MAASLCLHLGLHVSQLENLEETPARHEISAVLSETRNSRVKAFWAYLFVDRFVQCSSYVPNLLFSTPSPFP